MIAGNLENMYFETPHDSDFMDQDNHSFFISGDGVEVVLDVSTDNTPLVAGYQYNGFNGYRI